MLVQRLSHLHGLSRWPYHFAALGLQPSRVGAALDSAIGLRATAELLLLSVRRSNAELGGLLAPHAEVVVEVTVPARVAPEHR